MAPTDPEAPPPPPPRTRKGARPDDEDEFDVPRTLRGKGRPAGKRPSLTLEALAPLSTEEGAAMDARARALRAESRVLKRPQRAPDEPAVSRVLERPQGPPAAALSRVLERPETGLAASREPRTLPPRIVSPSAEAAAPDKSGPSSGSAPGSSGQQSKKGPKSRSGQRPKPKPAAAADPSAREALAIQMRIEGAGKRGGVAVEPPPVEEGDEWAVSFVDVFTLLLTLFIMLMSRMQLKTDAIDPEGVAKTEAALVAAEKKVAVFEKEIVKLKKKVGDPPPFEFPVGQLGNDVQVTRVKGGIQLAISDKILFTPGSAKLKPEGLSVLDSLLRLLMSGRFPITVEGHTDNMPIGTAMFPSNWELSAARASSVVRHLIAQGIPDRRLKAVGYADTQPVAGNDTLEGRARNRRVSLTLIQE